MNIYNYKCQGGQGSPKARLKPWAHGLNLLYRMLTDIKTLRNMEVPVHANFYKDVIAGTQIAHTIYYTFGSFWQMVIRTFFCLDFTYIHFYMQKNISIPRYRNKCVSALCTTFYKKCRHHIRPSGYR